MGGTYYGLSSHMFTKESFAALVKKRQALLAGAAPDGESDGAGMRADDRVVANKLCGICSSGLQTAVLIYSDPMSKVWVQIFLQVGAPLKAWHGQCAQECRSAEGCATWTQNQLMGGFFVHLLKIFRVFADRGRLQEIGITSRLAPGIPGVASHPFVTEQDEMAALSGEFAMSLIKNRLQRFITLARGWPNKTCLFALICKDGLVMPHLTQLQDDVRNYAKLLTMTSRTARDMVKRSLFKVVTVQQVVEVCKSFAAASPCPTALASSSRGAAAPH